MDREVHLTADGASSTPGARGVAALVRELADDGSELVRQEARLVRLEVTGLAGTAARGSAAVATGGVLLLLGGLAVLVGIVFLIGQQWIVGQYWLAALIVFALAAGMAAAAGMRGKRLLSPANLEPWQTLGTLKENAAWLTRQMQSGATSK